MLKKINDKYKIDEYGAVFNTYTNKYLKQYDNGFGYKYVMLTLNGKYKQYKVHRLVAQAFIDNPDNKPFVNHLDCDRSNNYYKNLEWCTQKENINYAQKVNSPYNKRNKKVGKFDKYNNLIEIYESISEASRQTGINIASISYSANGIRKSGGGYLWHFV